ACPWDPSSTSSMSELAGNGDAAGLLWYKLVLEPPRWVLPVVLLSCRRRRGCCRAGSWPWEPSSTSPRSEVAGKGDAAGLLRCKLVLGPPRWVLPVVMVSCRPRRGCCNAGACPWDPSSTSSMSELAGNGDAAGLLWYKLVLEPPGGEVRLELHKGCRLL